MKCARYYGFRNIQNLVRKLKPARQSKLPGAARRMTPTGGAGSASEYAYVEVMACPGGCTNGGGQIKIEDVAEILPHTRREEVVNANSPQGQKEWLKRVDEAYYSADSEEDVSSDDVFMTNGVNGDISSGTNGHSKEGLFVNGVDTDQVCDFLHHWSSLVGVPVSKLAYTTFREVESDVGKNKPASKMSDTERIASIAGLSGGGW